MAIDFPASPTVGQEHVSGGMTYVYNGTGWTIKGGSTTGFVLKAGDTMTGVLQVNQEIIAKAGHAGGHGRMRIDNDGGSLSSKLTFRSVGADMWDVGAGGSAPQDFAISSANGVALAINRTTSEVTTPIDPISALGVVNLRSMKAYAAPLDAMAYSGMQVNGSFDVSQERGYEAITTVSGQYACDGWMLQFQGTMSVALGNWAGSPTISQRRLGLGVFTAQASLGASDYVTAMHHIEGYRVARLCWGTTSAQPITIAFWIKHNVAGTYSVTILNGAANRSYVTSYTQNAADTSEYKTLTIPGDQTGTWTKDNTVGMIVVFTLACGTSRIVVSPNTWGAGAPLAVAGQVNGVSTTSNSMFFSNVIVLPGTQAPTAAQSPLIMRPYDQELVTCQRYFQVLTPVTADNMVGIGHFYSAGQLDFPVRFSATMRASPTLSQVSGANFFKAWRSGGSETFAGFTAANLHTDGAWLYSTGHAATAGAGATIAYNSATAKISFDARL